MSAHEDYRIGVALFREKAELHDTIFVTELEIEQNDIR